MICAVSPINESNCMDSHRITLGEGVSSLAIFTTRNYLLLINLKVDIESVHDACLDSAHKEMHHPRVVVALAGGDFHRSGCVLIRTMRTAPGRKRLRLYS